MRGTHAAALVLSLALAGCKFDEVALPSTPPQVVVQAVLYTGASSQVVLVERSLTGAAPVKNGLFNPLEPILSDGGLPITGATVDLITPIGVVLHAVEDRLVTTNHEGAGVYRFALDGSVLQRGGAYTLHIRTPAGEEVGATTRVPGNSAATQAVPRLDAFNRSRDTLKIGWSATANTRSYALRIDGPFGPFFLFTDSLRVRFSGDLRNLFTENFPRVFIPGFRESVLVSAVDSNYYDYYRTQNDPFTGSGIISRVSGGIGFFGSMIDAAVHIVDVTADRADSVEGRFVYLAAPGALVPPPATEFSVFIESPPAKDGAPAALSGNYLSPSRQLRGLLGAQLGKTVTLSLLAGQTARDTSIVFTGTLSGNRLVGSFRDTTGVPGNPVTFVKSP